MNCCEDAAERASNASLRQSGGNIQEKGPVNMAFLELKGHTEEEDYYTWAVPIYFVRVSSPRRGEMEMPSNKMMGVIQHSNLRLEEVIRYSAIRKWSRTTSVVPLNLNR